MFEDVFGISEKIDQLIEALERPVFYADWQFWSAFFLFITLLFMIKYTLETKKLAIQAKDSNLRPIILRAGFLSKGWQGIKFEIGDNKIINGIPLRFDVLKNVATQISGYIIIDGLQYELLFGGEISRTNEGNTSYVKKWSWMDSDKSLFAIFNNSLGKACEKPNQIVINYKDIEGNSYYFREDTNFNHTAKRGENPF